HLLGLAHEDLEVALILEALRVDLVDVLGAGGPGGKPSAEGYHLQAVDRRIVARSARELGGDRLAGQRRGLDGLGRQLREPSLLVGRRRRVDARIARRAELLRQLLVVLAWILAGAGGDLGREQVHDRAVLVSGPHRAVVPQEARPRAFLASEAARAVEETRHEPLEAYRHLGQTPAELLHHPIDHAAADQRLAHRGVDGPVWP